MTPASTITLAPPMGSAAKAYLLEIEGVKVFRKSPISLGIQRKTIL